MICGIYLITALHPLGQAFWSQPIASFVPTYGPALARHADRVLGLTSGRAGRWMWKTWAVQMSLETLPVNVGFMLVGAFGTLGNIVGR